MAAIRHYIILVFLATVTYTEAQTVETPEVHVDSIEIIGKSAVNNIVVLGSSKRAIVQNPTQILNTNSGVTIRSGGPALINTILNRGMASRHVGVFWSGVNIQSVVNGTYDVGLLPNAFQKSIFHLPNSGGRAGQASAAGALILRPDLSGNSTSILLSYGSDDNKRFRIQNQISKSKYKHDITLSGRDDENHYTYYNQTIKSEQTDAAIMQWDFTYNSLLKLHPRMDVKMGVWLQDAKRIIPPTKTSVSNSQEQDDKNYRFSLVGDYIGDDFTLNISSAYFDEDLFYRAPGIIPSSSNTNTYNIRTEFTHIMGSSIGFQFRKDGVSSINFRQVLINRNSLSFFIGQAFDFDKTKGNISIRWDEVDNNSQPFHVLGFLAHDISSSFSVNTTFGRSYTLPSLNDLYWRQGGNEDLLTEVSHSVDIGAIFTWQSSDRVSANLFYNSIDNWIQWTPQEGLFTPTNQKKIRNLGLEINGVYSMTFHKDIVLSVNPAYTWTHSTVADHYDTPSLVGKKSIFIPAHKIAMPISFDWDSWLLNVNSIFYSKRYDTVDNSTSVPGYTVMDAEISKSFKYKNIDSRISISIENIWNADYEHIRFYPMPLRIARVNLFTKF